jgi:hypothetical protein
MIKILIILPLFFSALLQAQSQEKNPFLNEQGKVVDKTEWPGDFAKVVAVSYDFTQEKSDSVVIDKRLHKGVFSVSPALTKDQVNALFTAITGTHTPWKGAVCYEPHHGFVFYDKNGTIIGSLSICFGCQQYRASPSGELSRHWDLEGLEKLVRELGIPFSDDYTKAYKEYKSQQGGADQPAAAPESKPESIENPKPESENVPR